MRLAIEWSLADAQLDYTTNENTVIFDGIQSWGRGDVTVNVTGDETLNGTQFYEGLRMGFEDVSGGYRMDGLRVGKGKSEAESAEVQGGVELLGALGMYRSFEFGSLDGHYTFGPGGSDGEGITINSYIVIQDGRIGALTEEFGQGIWADDLEFEAHIRDMTVDVTAEGLSLIQGRPGVRWISVTCGWVMLTMEQALVVLSGNDTVRTMKWSSVRPIRDERAFRLRSLMCSVRRRVIARTSLSGKRGGTLMPVASRKMVPECNS